MFNKKPRRNFRQRKGESSDDEEEQKNGDGGGNDKSAVSGVNKPSKLPPGRGISCSSKREATPPKSDSSDGEEAVEERESWDQNKNKDTQRKKDNTVLSFSDEKEVEGPAFKLKKCGDKAVLFQARRKEDSPARDTHTTAAASPRKSPDDDQASPDTRHQEEDDDDQASPDTRQQEEEDDDDESTLSSSPFSPASDSSTPKAVVIPDAKEIQAARRKRRGARAQKDYISLGRDGYRSAGSTPDRRSRDGDDDEDEDEVGGDDDDDEPDDHERRIEFAPRSKSIRERIAEKLGGSDAGASDSSEREEQDLWEETQIEKGVKRLPGEQSPSGSDASFSSTSTSSSRRARRQRTKKSKANLPKSLPPVTLSIVRRRITGKLESLRGVYRARQAELRRMQGDMESARSSLENLEDGSSDKQLRFYRSMTLYTHNLVECLREKVVEVNSLELELHAMLSDQTEALLAHRRQAVRGEAARLQQLSYATEGQTGDSSNGEPNQSESGSGDKGGQDSEDVPEDTQPSAEDQETLERKRADILSRSQVVFSDVQEDFSDVKKILCRFEDWRGAYSDSYHTAYISLCLPKLLSPIVRHQLLAWDPLQSSADFEALPWYSAVETFCHGQGYEESDHADKRTLPNVVEKTLLPKLTAYVELVWDPLSVRQSVCLSDVCHRLREDYGIFRGERSKPVKALVEAVISRLRSSVDEDVFIPLYPKKFLEDQSSPQRRFRDQQFWMAVKLLGNMGKWDEVVPESTLKELMLDKLLNRYLMITLLNHTQPRHTVRTCRKIADSLPVSWCEGVSVCLSQLQSFSNHLVQVAHSICKQDSPPDPSTRAAVVEVLEVLRTIRAFDCITDIADKYHYQDVVQSLQLLN